MKEDFYVYTTYKTLNGDPFPSNSMYVVTVSGVVLIDTPWDSTQFRPLLDSIERRHSRSVIMCIASHYHDDRTSGLEFFKDKDIPTFSSRFTQQLCKDHNEKQAEYTFVQDTIFDFGDHVMEVYYPGEGHTKDNIVIWFEVEKILYGGCLVKSVESKGLGNVADANIEAWPVTIEKLINRFPDHEFVIPGHFGWQGNESLEHTLKLLQKKK